ncbi:glycosyltransferase WbuB [Saccharopolyspora aridisoli]|uniref:Glycosyltransferase WbuB n=1 Tax=Saccharopolyspora aridisoli TaxID=2530385 RepID=A0A4V2Y827_9PSEU|nr:glycosyltransferase family 4 protein [Saccharopolyspora aridisoli]TDC94035.1 glycosyltransferase WbuB [Saccharopolyspora aridisoli]
MSPSILVLNQFAKPRSETGCTRHVELFERLRGRFRIIAGDRDFYSRRRFSVREPGFTTIRVSSYNRNDHRRVLNWLSYCVGTIWSGIRCERPSVVYAVSPHLLTPLVGWLLARLWRSRFVFEVQDLWPRSLVELGHLREGSMLHRALSTLERWLYYRADHIVIVTDGWRPYFDQLGIDLRRVTTISNGAEPDDFQPDPSMTPLRERVPVNGRLIVFAGAHGVKDGVQAVLEAAAELQEHTFVLIGDGMDKSRLVEHAREEELFNVYFLDMLPKKELCGILGGADIGVHAVANLPLFRLGMSPNKLYDYLAAGLPVVTNAKGEPHAIVQTSNAGLGVAPGDLADGIRALANLDDKMLAQMRDNAVAYMREHKSRSVQAKRLQSVLDELVGYTKGDCHQSAIH